MTTPTRTERSAANSSIAAAHDALRTLSCPNARLAGLDGVLDRWQAPD